MLTPSDPTTALAALIAGNQRHVDRRANGRSATVSTRIPPASAKPFALSIEIERMREPLTDLFDVSVDQVHSFVLSPGSGDMRSGRFEVMVSSEEDLVRIVDGSVEALGFSLVVVLGRLKEHVAEIDLAFRSAENRCFGVARQLLLSNGPLATSIATGRIRMVGAVVDERDGRVHWLGEHPDQKALLRSGK
jgi:hypothetical protein